MPVRAGRALASGIGEPVAQPPTREQLTADARSRAATELRSRGAPPEAVRAVESGEMDGDIQKILAGAAATAAGVVGYAACIAPFVAAAVATGGAAAPAPLLAEALCLGVGSTVGAVAAWMVMNADDAWRWVADLFSDDDGLTWSEKHDLDGATGKLRWPSVPEHLLPLLVMGNLAPFRADAGPFEGLWRVEESWSPATPHMVRLYDRDGWVLGWSTERVRRWLKLAEPAS